MEHKAPAHRQLRVAYRNLEMVLIEADELREEFAQVCREVHQDGLSDQQISDITKDAGGGYSRARIQQVRVA